MARITIKDIARISGFAVSTVSRALNNHPDVSKEAHDKIHAIVEQYKFTPNENAKQLKQTSSKNIGIIVLGSFNLFFSVMIEEIQHYIYRFGYTSLVYYIKETDNEIKKAEQIYREKKVVGIIFLGGNRKRFAREFKITEIPCVVATTDTSGLKIPNLSSVSVDDMESTEIAIAYLYENGHRKIGLITADSDKSYAGNLRYQGCVKAFKKYGLELDPDLVTVADFNMQSGFNAMNRILESGKSVTAVFAVADIMAIGASKAIWDRGLSIPDDISLMGFDGIEMTKFMHPAITTIKQPLKNIAKLSVEILITNIQAEVPVESHQVLDITLQAGASVMKIVPIEHP